MTETEQRYAQIEKELLAIVWSCNKFNQYIYGKNKVIIHSDHKPLERIMKKPLNEMSTRLQKMCLKIQKYDIEVIHKPGKEIVIADTLSRAYIQDKQTEDVLPDVIATISLSISEDRRNKLIKEVENDYTCQRLSIYTRTEWPKKNETPESVIPYRSMRNTITEVDGLLFKDERIIILNNMKTEMLECAHFAHAGIGACQRRLRDSMYWPGMTKYLEKFVENGSICRKHAEQTVKNEPMIPHDIGSHPWSKIGMDLCQYENRMLLVITDCYTNLIQVEKLSLTNTLYIKNILMRLFAVLGIPEEIVTDNGPQFRDEFKNFCRKLDIKHSTSSPYHPQGNAKAENAVKTVKRILKKCKNSEHLALLEFNTTITEGYATSPAERFFGRRCRGQMITTKKSLRPKYNTKEEDIVRNRLIITQKKYHDRNVRERKELKKEQPVLMKKPGETTWSIGKSKEMLAERKYLIEVDEKQYVRNRRDLIKLNETNDEEIDTPRDEQEMEEVETPRRSVKITKLPARFRDD